MGKVVNGRDPAAMPWKDMDVEVIIESTGAFNSLEGGSKHMDAGAKKVVLTAPGKNCPTYVVGVNEEDYDAEKDTVVSNASCTTNGMASVCKVLDESFEVQYGMMTTTHSYTGDHDPGWPAPRLAPCPCGRMQHRTHLHWSCQGRG